MSDTARVLLAELRGTGHRIRPSGERLLLTPTLGQRLTDEQRVGITEHKLELLGILRGEIFRAAMATACEQLALEWVSSVQPSLGTIAAEAELDLAAEHVESDLDTALEAMARWRDLWLERCRAEKSYHSKAGQAPSTGGRIGRDRP